MLRILFSQVLPLLLAVLGTITFSQTGSRLRWWAGISLWVVAIGLVTFLAVSDILAQQRLETRVRALTTKIRDEVNEASTLEYRMRGDPDAQANFPMYLKEIEHWRDRVTAFLAKELPDSGADLRFLTGTGVVGQGPLLYEYTRLVLLRSNLLAVLDGLPGYIARSRS